MTYYILPNGDMIFILFPHAVENYREELEEAIHLCDLLEIAGMLGNGWHDATDIVALTSAPIISDSIEFDEDNMGEAYVPEEANIWYYKDYMLENLFERLLNDGYVIFTAHEDNDSEEVDSYQFCSNPFAFNVVSYLFPEKKAEIIEGKFHFDGLTCDSPTQTFPHLVDGPFVPFWKKEDGMKEHFEMISHYDSPWAGIFALEYTPWGEDEELSYTFNTILDVYDRGEVRTDVNGNRHISDLIILDTP